MKRVTVCMLIVLLTLAFAGCSKETGDSPSSEEHKTQEQQEAKTKKDGKVLIAYFSRVGNVDHEEEVDAASSASIQVIGGKHRGNTEIIAELIESETGGDLFFIETEKKYPTNYEELEDLAQEEGSRGERPALASHVEDMASYETIYLGFPNWWFDMPMAVYSFLEEYDLSGKTIIPFCTSGGSGFSNAMEAIRELQPAAEVLEGLPIYQDDVTDSADEVKEWLSHLN